MTDLPRIDPELFTAAAVDEETAVFNAELEKLLASFPPLWETDPVEARRAREEGRSAFGPLQLSDRAQTRTIPGPAGPIGLRVFVPDEPRGVYLHLHGGGWVLGGAHHQDPRLELLADTCEVAVVSVDYRLAPEDPYPAGPDDCEAAAVWLADTAADEFGTDRLLIGGESAGAHLAAVTLLRMRDRHDFTGFLGANLVYGAFDLRLTPSARHWGDRRLVLDTRTMQWFIDHFVPPDLRDDPDVSPLLADLRDLPPALFTVGTEDPLLDDTLLMAARWTAAGNEAISAVYPGGAHAFDAFPTDLGRSALLRMHAFIRTRIA